MMLILFGYVGWAVVGTVQGNFVVWLYVLSLYQKINSKPLLCCDKVKEGVVTNCNATDLFSCFLNVHLPPKILKHLKVRIAESLIANSFSNEFVTNS